MSLNHVQRLSVLRELARTAPIPWAGAILAISTTVVQNVAIAKHNIDDLHAIASRIADIASVLIPALCKPGVAIDSSLASCAQATLSALEDIAQAVEKRLSAQGKIRNFLAASSDRLATRQAEERFEMAIESLTLQLNLSNLRLSAKAKDHQVGSLKSRVENIQTEELEHIRGELSRMDIDRKRFPVQEIPHASQVFFGREREVDRMLSLLGQHEQALIAVLGPGGIGKTSLVLSLMRHQTVIDRFDHRRYLIACDSTDTAEALRDRLASTLSLEEKNPLQGLRKMAAQVERPVLIVLDNFETPWDSKDTRQSVESFLSNLSLIPQISIIITMRGAERPAGISWTKPFLPPVQPLDLQSAIQIFSSIADTPEDDPYVKQLISAVDMIPLAVTLLATQAQFLTCQELLERWKDHKTKVVTRGYDERLSSLDLSIQISLSSPRFTQVPAAKTLLQLLAILPDGAPDTLLASMSEESFPIHDASATLLRVSLAFRSTDGYLRSLAPVREHVLDRSPISTEQLQIALEYLRRVTMELHADRDSHEGLQRITEWTPQFGNMRHVVEICLSRPGDIDPATSTDLAFHLGLIQSGVVSIESILGLWRKAARVADHAGLPLQRARLGLQLAELNVEDMLQVLRQEGDRAALLNGLRMAGMFYFYDMEQDDKTLETLDEGWRMDHSDIPVGEVLRYHIEHAGILRRCHRQSQAAEIYHRCLLLVQDDAYALQRPGVFRGLASMSLVRGLYSESLRYTQAALDSAIRVDSDMARTLMLSGIIMSRQSRMEEAEKVYILSYQIFEQLELSSWTATIEGRLINIYLSLGEQSKAYPLLEKFLQSDSRLGPAFSLQLQLTYHISQSHSREAQGVLEDLVTLRRRQKTTGNHGFRIFSGQLFTGMGMMSEALNELIFILILGRKGGCRLGMSMALLRLGDVFRLQTTPDLLTAKGCYEASQALVRNIGAFRHDADAAIRIALVQAAQGSFSEALGSFSRASRLFTHAGHPKGVEACQRYISQLGHAVDRISQIDSTRLFSALEAPIPSFIGHDDF